MLDRTGMWIEDRQKLLKEYCQGKIWYGRALLIMFFIYLGIRYLIDPAYACLFGAINLGIHELGHVVFSFAGEFLTVLGGTILQTTAPIVSVFMFLKQGDYFALTFSGVWLATNFYNIAVYIGDAQAQVLPLVTIGGGPARHDWQYLLSRMGVLSHDRVIASFVRGMGFLFMWVSIVLGIYIVWLMIRSDFSRENNGGTDICED